MNVDVQCSCVILKGEQGHDSFYLHLTDTLKSRVFRFKMNTSLIHIIKKWIPEKAKLLILVAAMGLY